MRFAVYFPQIEQVLSHTNGPHSFHMSWYFPFFLGDRSTLLCTELFPDYTTDLKVVHLNLSPYNPKIATYQSY